MKVTKVKSGQVLVETTGTLFWRPLDVLLFRRPRIVICISRMRNRTLTYREKNCRQGRFAAETRQSQGRQRIS
jgi:hypothetical protein